MADGKVATALRDVTLDDKYDLTKDRVFISGTQAIIRLAGGLGLRVVAEGVGTHAQLEFLKAWGCDCFQGFLTSEPLPAARVGDFVRDYHG